MAYLFPRFALAPVRCAAPVVRHDIAPLWSLFDDATRQIQRLERQTRRSAAPFNPRFDVKEDKESYVLEGEVPGFKEGDLSIEWKDNVLAIRGRHESVVESGQKPSEAIQQTPTVVDEQQQAITPNAPESDTSSIKSSSTKSYQATVEDEESEAAAANASAAVVAESSSTAAAAAASVQPTPEEPSSPSTTNSVQHWISERRSGQFLRQFTFPSNAVNHEAIKASLESGILKIVVPKAPAPESRRIFIE